MKKAEYAGNIAGFMLKVLLVYTLVTAVAYAVWLQKSGSSLDICEYARQCARNRNDLFEFKSNLTTDMRMERMRKDYERRFCLCVFGSDRLRLDTLKTTFVEEHAALRPEEQEEFLKKGLGIISSSISMGELDKILGFAGGIGMDKIAFVSDDIYKRDQYNAGLSLDSPGTRGDKPEGTANAEFDGRSISVEGETIATDMPDCLNNLPDILARELPRLNITEILLRVSPRCPAKKVTRLLEILKQFNLKVVLLIKPRENPVMNSL